MDHWGTPPNPRQRGIPLWTPQLSQWWSLSDPPLGYGQEERQRGGPLWTPHISGTSPKRPVPATDTLETARPELVEGTGRVLRCWGIGSAVIWLSLGRGVAPGDVGQVCAGGAPR